MFFGFHFFFLIFGLNRRGYFELDVLETVLASYVLSAVTSGYKII